MNKPAKDPLPEKVPPKDLSQERFQALMTEYASLRAEAQQEDAHQIQLVTVTFSTLAALVSAAAAFHNKIPNRAALFLSFVALPCLTMFMGILWIDLLYRKTRFGAYTKVLENKINRLLSGQPLSDLPGGVRVMEWEHWIQELEQSGKKPKGVCGKLRAFPNNARYFRG